MHATQAEQQYYRIIFVGTIWVALPAISLGRHNRVKRLLSSRNVKAANLAGF